MNDKIIRVIVYGLILIFAAITIRSYSLRNYSAQQACIDNLRIVDNGGAMSVSLPEKPMPPDALLAKKLHQRLSQYYKEHKHYPDSLKDIIASNGVDRVSQADLGKFSYTNEGNQCVISFTTTEGGICRITSMAGK